MLRWKYNIRLIIANVLYIVSRNLSIFITNGQIEKKNIDNIYWIFTGKLSKKFIRPAGYMAIGYKRDFAKIVSFGRNTSGKCNIFLMSIYNISTLKSLLNQVNHFNLLLLIIENLVQRLSDCIHGCYSEIKFRYWPMNSFNNWGWLSIRFSILDASFIFNAVDFVLQMNWRALCFGSSQKFSWASISLSMAFSGVNVEAKAAVHSNFKICRPYLSATV